MNAINLIPGYYIQARRRKSRLRSWVVVCGGYALAVTGVCAGLTMAGGSTSRALADELTRVTRELEQTTQQVAALQPELSEAQLQLEASRAVAVQPDWAVLLALLGKLRGEFIVLDRAVLTPVQPVEAKPVMKLGARPAGKPEQKGAGSVRKSLNFKIEVSGLGKTQNDVSQFVLRLEQAGLFNRVKLMETSIGRFNNEPATAFRLECLMNEEVRAGK